MTTFVLLHYLVADETIKCTNSILKNVDGEKRIVIVDNSSPNNSFLEIKKYYHNEKDVIIIQNEDNNGYASGINLGYKYAALHYDNEFIICMNNDMEILQNDFISKIQESYRKNHFYVLGPDIYSTSAKRHQNPEKDHIRTIDDVEEHMRSIDTIRKNRIKLKIKGLLKRNAIVNELYYRRKQEKEECVDNSIQENVTLHGSCLIFSKQFIMKREYALNPGTFFYCESQILDYECLRDGMLAIYDPNVKIYHHEDVATDAVAGSYEKKMLQKCNRVYESLAFMKQIMMEDARRNGMCSNSTSNI